MQRDKAKHVKQDPYDLVTTSESGDDGDETEEDSTEDLSAGEGTDDSIGFDDSGDDVLVRLTRV